MLYLFLNPDNLDDGFPDLCSKFMPEWRTDIMLSYRSCNDRKLSALGYLLLIRGLKDRGVFNGMPQFRCGEYGKPYLVGYDGIEFNISHCRHGVAVAVEGAPVGVDIEDVSEFDDQLARRVCNDGEYRMICGSVSPAREFCRIWTMKEAVLKYYGMGIDDTVIKDILINDDFSLDSYNLNDGEMFMSVCRQKIK